MEARIGDRVVVRGRRIGQTEREGEILEVRGERGEPPYVVRWTADGREGLFFPGPDTSVEHRGRRRR